MRGARDGCESVSVALGIIPAYAGSTKRRDGGQGRQRDHPRVCGEHAAKARRRGLVSGSSPRMRGARDNGRERLRAEGIIPAYAGSTTSCARSRTGRWDHPRVCGEHRIPHMKTFGDTGSSPRMRGARTATVDDSICQRIIPAYAGSTAVAKVNHAAVGDHPRVCGEHAWSRRSSPSELGSSPRMRGAPDAPFAVAGSAGIIPAYAGSTRPTSTARCSPRDHPRVCGEHIKNQRDAGEGEGSSPRMRGALGENRRIRSTHGFIPAYAGSTRLAARFHRTNGVHPRVCGEHGQDAQEAGGGRGSSPRMRGALALREDPVLQRGFIPAYAGSTSRWSS